ncbi:MAG: hypothetical protein ACREX3_15900 [Gammaproteobacteria bacterium]
MHLHFHSHDNRVLHGHLHAHDRSVSRRSHAGDPHAHEHGAVLVPRRYWRFYLCHSSDRLGSASPICALGLGVLVGHDDLGGLLGGLMIWLRRWGDGVITALRSGVATGAISLGAQYALCSWMRYPASCKVACMRRGRSLRHGCLW